MGPTAGESLRRVGVQLIGRGSALRRASRLLPGAELSAPVASAGARRCSSKCVPFFHIASRDRRQLPCEHNPGASAPGALAQRQIPPLERTIGGGFSKDHGRDDQVRPRQLVPTLRNAAGPRLHAGLVASRRQAEIGADMACKPEARRIVDRRVERYRADRPTPGTSISRLHTGCDRAVFARPASSFLR